MENLNTMTLTDGWWGREANKLSNYYISPSDKRAFLNGINAYSSLTGQIYSEGTWANAKKALGDIVRAAAVLAGKYKAGTKTSREAVIAAGEKASWRYGDISRWERLHGLSKSIKWDTVSGKEDWVRAFCLWTAAEDLLRFSKHVGDNKGISDFTVVAQLGGQLVSPKERNALKEKLNESKGPLGLDDFTVQYFVQGVESEFKRRFNNQYARKQLWWGMFRTEFEDEWKDFRRQQNAHLNG